MRCPACVSDDTKVLESREVDSGSAIRRRRQCLNCDNRFTTYERIEAPHLLVVKKNGDRELFDRQKIANGVYKAFEKRPVEASRIEGIIVEVERDAQSQGGSEISASQLGEILMEKLRETDDVAYVRFASVYRSFADLESFERELSQLKKRHTAKKSL